MWQANHIHGLSSSCFGLGDKRPFFDFSEAWQLIINTSTTIITFLMVFLIQNAQNRDGVAIQAKLDELLRTSDALNSFIGIEQLSDKEICEIRDRCEAAAKKSDAELNKKRPESLLLLEKGETGLEASR